MSEYNNTISKLREGALSILKRDLTEKEEQEFKNFAAAIGNYDSAGDFIYFWLTQYRGVEFIENAIGEMNNVVTKTVEEMRVNIDEELKKIDDSLNKIVTEHEGFKEAFNDQFRAVISEQTHLAVIQEIRTIDDESKKILEENKEYFKLRASMFFIAMMGLVASVAYIFGTVGFQYVSGASENIVGRLLGTVVNLKAGWWILYSVVVWGATWIYENWDNIKAKDKDTKSYRIKALSYAAAAVFLFLTMIFAR